MHWEQVAADLDELAIKDAFLEVTIGLIKDAPKNGRDARRSNRGGDSAP